MSRRPVTSGAGRPGAGTSALAASAAAASERRRAVVRTSVLAVLAALAGGAAAWRINRLGPGGTGAGVAVVRRVGVPVVVALVVVALVAARSAWAGRPVPDPGRWARGAAGEAATAALLDVLGRRWVVRHDLAVPGSRANLDHVVIGPTGVWVVDSKAYRAPLRAGWRSVRAGDRPVEVSAVAWEAQVVADRLGVEVRPLVAVHGRAGGGRTGRAGRGLPDRGRKVDGVGVLPAPVLVARLRRGRWTWWCRPGRSRHLGPVAVTRLARSLDATFLPAAWQDAVPDGHTGRGRAHQR